MQLSRVWDAVAVLGFLLLAALVIAGGLSLAESYAWWARAATLAGVLTAGIVTFGIFLYIREALQRPETLREILRDVGVLSFGVLAVVSCYATGYALLGISYTVEVIRRADVTIVPLRHDFPTAVYFSTITLSTLGYGDFQPSVAARGLAAVESLNGYLMLGLLASYIFKLLEIRVAPDDDR